MVKHHDIGPPREQLTETPTQPSADERCDRAHVERAYWRVTSPTSGLVLTLCRYHFRRYQIPLAMEGWNAQELGGGNHDEPQP